MSAKTLALTATFAACAIAVWAYASYNANNRYVITNAGGGAVYKTDQRTGKTTVLYQGKELEVQQYVFVQPTPAPAEVPTPPDRVAVTLAQQAKTLDSHKYFENQVWLARWLADQKGDIRIVGWSAKAVSDQTYLVTYALIRDGKNEEFRFEVNLAAQLVRNVKGDPVLEAKYSGN